MVRLSSAFVLVATLFASAFAAPSETCADSIVHDIDHIGSLVREVYHLVKEQHDDFTVFGEKTSEFIHEIEAATEKTKDCSRFSDEEAKRAVIEVYDFIPDCESLFRELEEARGVICGLPDKTIAEDVEKTLVNMERAVNAFDDRMEALMPEDYSDVVAAIKDTFKDDFQRLVDAFKCAN